MEGLDDISTVNNALSDNPVFLGMKTSANIDALSSRIKDFGNIKKLDLQSQANLASLTAEVNNLETIEKISPKNTTGISSLTKQVNDLADLKQEVTNLTSKINHNTTLINKVGKNITRRALNAAAPDTKVDPPPKGTGSSWPPPSGFAGAVPIIRN